MLPQVKERPLPFSAAKKLPKDIINLKLSGQLIDASGSVGANYREANEAVSGKDFAHKMKITRKECKESSYWLNLLKEANIQFAPEIENFINESKELRSIFTSIIDKSIQRN